MFLLTCLLILQCQTQKHHIMPISFDYCITRAMALSSMSYNKTAFLNFSLLQS